MTCINGGSIIVCVNPWVRLKVGNRYVWVDFHEYCGPSFYTNAAMTAVYDPKDENDPVWEPFGRWLDKYRAAKDRQQRARTAGVTPTHTVGGLMGLLRSMGCHPNTSEDIRRVREYAAQITHGVPEVPKC